MGILFSQFGVVTPEPNIFGSISLTSSKPSARTAGRVSLLQTFTSKFQHAVARRRNTFLASPVLAEYLLYQMPAAAGRMSPSSTMRRW